MTKQTFTIPEGCKAVTVEQVGNQLITTFEPIKKERRRADYGCVYYAIDISTTRLVYYSEECGDEIDNRNYNSSNYFQTEEQAQRAATRLKSELDKFWEEELK